MVAVAGVAAACSHAPPTGELSLARTSVALAVTHADAGAAAVKRAEDKLALARRLMDAGDHGPALWLAEQAQVDAELAIARASASDARRSLSQRQQAGAAPLLPILVAEKAR
jgi:hypothetical protein